jgi:hypothetical protein
MIGKRNQPHLHDDLAVFVDLPAIAADMGISHLVPEFSQYLNFTGRTFCTILCDKTYGFISPSSVTQRLSVVILCPNLAPACRMSLLR